MERPRRQYDDNNFDVKNCDLSRRLQVPVLRSSNHRLYKEPTRLDLGILELLHVELIR